MGGELGDEDERLISRLENNQFKPSDHAEESNPSQMYAADPSSLHSPAPASRGAVFALNQSGGEGENMTPCFRR